MTDIQKSYSLVEEALDTLKQDVKEQREKSVDNEPRDAPSIDIRDQLNRDIRESMEYIEIDSTSDISDYYDAFFREFEEIDTPADVSWSQLEHILKRILVLLEQERGVK